MLSNHPNCLGGNGPSASSDLIGDVDGPASATDNAVARFDGTTGKLIQNSVVTIDDTTGAIAGAQSLTSPASTNLTLAGGAGNSSIILTPAGTGNVGIGTTTPTAKLEVVDTNQTLLYARTNFDVLTSETATINKGGTIGLGGYYNGTTDKSPFAAIRGAKETATNGNQSGYMSLYTVDNSAGHREWVRISSAGTVSIASTTAGASNVGALVVAGGISAGNTGSAASYFGGAVTTGGNGTFGGNSLAGNRILTVSNTATADGAWASIAVDTSASGLKLVHLSSGWASTFLTGGPTTTQAAIYTSSSAPIVFGVNSTYVGKAESTGWTFAGAVTANGTGTFGSSFGKVIINQWSDATNYGAITLNGNTTVAGSLGIGGGASGDSTLYFNAPTGGSIQARINGTAALTIASTSAATFAGAVTVTGALKLGNAYVAGAVVGTGSITIQDSTGTTYRIPVLV